MSSAGKSNCRYTLVIVGLGIFAWRACHQRPYRRSQAGLGIFLLAILIGWWAIIPVMGNAAVARRKADETAANNAAMSKSIAQIEAVLKQLGRLPDESELNTVLDEPLPRIRSGSFETQIKYQRIKDGEYELSFCCWDIFLYRSSTPKKGWYRIPF